MYKNKNIQRIISSFLVVVLLLQAAEAPIAKAASFNILPEPVTAHAEEIANKESVIAVVVDEDLMNNNAPYDGLISSVSMEHPNALTASTLPERIRRYALDIQRTRERTRSIIITVRRDQPVQEIAHSLERLYLEGSSEISALNQLAGVVLIGDVPLPVVNKNGNRFISMYPYTDFVDKSYTYNSAIEEFIPSTLTEFPKPEVWHGVIKPPLPGEDGNNLLAEYFDKNHLFHCSSTACSAAAEEYRQFSRKLLYADFINEFVQMDKAGFPNYQRYLNYWEDITYNRFTRELLKQMLSETEEQYEAGDGIDNDGDGRIDEDPFNGVDDDLDGEAGSPLHGMADGIDNDNDGEIDEQDEGRFGLCEGSYTFRDCRVSGVPLLTGNFYNLKSDPKYKVADGIDNDNDGLTDEGIDEDDGNLFKGIDNDLDGRIDEDTTTDNDADGDGQSDEDGPGDANDDGCSGVCGVDEDLDSYDFDSDGYPNGYERDYGSLIAGVNSPTNPENPASFPWNLTLVIPTPRFTPVPDSDDWVDEEPAADDDEDGRINEDGTADNDNDGDGQIDEDSDGGSINANQNFVDSIPDAQTQELIRQLSTEYKGLFNKFLGTLNDWTSSTGRYRSSYDTSVGNTVQQRSDVSNMPILITIKDETVRLYLRKVGDAIERKIEEISGQLADRIPLMEKSTIRAEVLLADPDAVPQVTIANDFSSEYIDIIRDEIAVNVEDAVDSLTASHPVLETAAVTVYVWSEEEDIQVTSLSTGPYAYVYTYDFDHDVDENAPDYVAPPEDQLDYLEELNVRIKVSVPATEETDPVLIALFDAALTSAKTAIGNELDDAIEPLGTAVPVIEDSSFNVELQITSGLLQEGEEIEFVTVTQNGSYYYFNGERANQITDPVQCSIYRGSSKIVEALRVYNAFAAEVSDDYAGCSPQNIFHPERCFPDLAKRVILDLQGTRDTENIRVSKTDYRACLNFREREGYEEFKEEAQDYLDDLDSADTEDEKLALDLPRPPNTSPNNIILFTTEGMSPAPAVPVELTFADLLEKWGQGDKVDNDNDGRTDEVDEGVSRYAIPINDSEKIGDRVLLGVDFLNNDDIPDNVEYTFKGTPDFMPGVERVTLYVSPDPMGASGNERLLSTLTIHKEPTDETLEIHSDPFQTPNSLPVDDPRYLSFRDSRGQLQKIYYPNVFAKDDYNELRNSLISLENALAQIAVRNGVNVNTAGELTGIIEGGGNQYIDSQLTDLGVADADMVADAYEWKKFNIDEKHQYMFRTLLSPNMDAYIGSVEVPGYEVLYLVGNGDSDELMMNFNGDIPEEENDSEFLEALSRRRSFETVGPEETGTTQQPLGAAGAPSADAIAGPDAQKFEEGIDIWQWFIEIQEWIEEIINNSSQYTAGEVCGFSDPAGDYYEQLLERGDMDGDGVPDDVDTNPFSSDSDGDGIPDGADNTKRFALSSNKTILRANSSDTLTVRVEAQDIDRNFQQTDSFTQVRLIINNPAGQEISRIGSTNPTSFVNGIAEFVLLPTSETGTFTVTASSPNRNGISVNTLTLESTNRRVRLSSFIRTEQSVFSAVGTSGFVIWDGSEIIADVDENTGLITIRDDYIDEYELIALPSLAGRPARLGIRNIETEEVIASVFFIVDESIPITLDSTSINYFSVFDALHGVHIKDLSPDDAFDVEIVPDDADFNAGNVYLNENGRKFGIVERSGNIFLKPGFKLHLKTPGRSEDPVVFEAVRENEKLFEIFIGADYPAIEVLEETGPFENFNILEEAYDLFVKLLPIKILRAYAQTVVPDSDDDGLNDLEELLLGLDHLNDDSDSDSYRDEFEILNNYDPLRAGAQLFSDLTTSSEGFSDIIKLFRRSILKGYSDGTFRPDQSITREEFIKLDLGAVCIQCAVFSDKKKAEVDAVYSQEPFPDNVSDFTPDLLYCVEEAKNLDIVSGYAGQPNRGFYLPKNPISRAEATKVIIETGRTEFENSLQITNYDLTGKPWFYNYVLTAQRERLYPRGRYVPLDTLSPDDFKTWFDQEISKTNSEFIDWLTDPITRREFAIMVASFTDEFNCLAMDSDGDGLPDNYEEYIYDTSLDDADTDGGGVSDLDEILRESDPNDPEDDIPRYDTDSDGLYDDEEEEYGTDPNKPDTDDGGIYDGVEIEGGTDPLDPSDDSGLDSDNDGMPDLWEIDNDLNPFDPSDANEDPDGDGLTNLEEYQYGTDPNVADTDGGGVNDGDEIIRGTDPLDPDDDFAAVPGEEGGYIVGDTVSLNEIVTQIGADDREPGEVLEYLDEIPADGESSLVLRASILDDNGDVDISDSSSFIRFFAEDGGNHASLTHETVRAAQGIAETELVSTIVAGTFTAAAEIVDGLIPYEPKPIYVVPLQPALITITPDSPIIRSSGFSTTNLNIQVKDIHGNPLNNDLVEITLLTDGPGSIDAGLDENSSKDGIQISTVTGEAQVELFSSGEAGTITITGSHEILPEEEGEIITVSGQATVSARNDITVRLTPESLSVPADGVTTNRIELEVTDSSGNMVTNFQGTANFRILNSNVGSFVTENEREIVDGTTYALFTSSVSSGTAEISVTVGGFDPVNVLFEVTPQSPRQIILESSDEFIEADPASSTLITGKLYDVNGNFTENDSSTVVDFRLTTASEQFAQFAGASSVTAENGIVRAEIRGTEYTGPINIVASAPGLVPGTISLNSVTKFHGSEFRDLFPNALYASLLGSEFGNAAEYDYLGGWFVFSGKSEAALSLSAAPVSFARLAEISPDGLVSIYDDGKFSSTFIPHNGSTYPNRIIISDMDSDEDIVQIFTIMNSSSQAGIVNNENDINETLDGSYARKTIASANYEFVNTAKGVSLLKEGNEAMQIMDNGNINILNNDINISIGDYSAAYYPTLIVNDGGTKIGAIYFVNNFSSDVREIDPKAQVDISSASYEAGTYYQQLSNRINIGYEPAFSGNSTALPKGIYITDKENELPSNQLPGQNYISVERSGEVPGIGFTGDNKHMLLFSAGNSVGESNLPYASEIGIVLGDPTIRISNSNTASVTGFTKDIGQEIYTDDAPIKEFIVMDYNSDGLDDVLIAYESGEVRLLQNEDRYPRFEDMGVFLVFPHGIISMDNADFNRDGMDDLIVATRDSCRNGDVCIDLYLNNQGNFIRENLDLESFDENNRVYMIRAEDMNNDLYPDIVTSDDAGTIRVFYNNRGTIESTGQSVGSLGINVNESANLKSEVLVRYDGLASPPTGVQIDTGYRVLSAGDNGERNFIFLDLAPKLSARSYKRARDLTAPANSVRRNDTIEYTIVLENTGNSSANNVMVADTVPGNLDLSENSFVCLDCGTQPEKIETGQSQYPIILSGFNIPAGESRTFKYQAKVKETPVIKFFTGNDLDEGYLPFSDDNLPDIGASPEGNPTGRVTYFYSLGTNPGNNHVVYDPYTSPPPDLPEPAPLPEGAIDPATLTIDEDNNGLPDSVEAYMEQAAEGKFNAQQSLHNLGDQLESLLNRLHCGQGCIPLPINYSFLTPGAINVFGVPGGFDPGLPVFAAGIPSIIPIWPPSPYQGSAFRLYLSPTLTGSLGTGICIGPYLGGVCWAFATPLPGLAGLCDAIAGEINGAIASANSAIAQLNEYSQTAFAADGSMPGTAAGRETSGGFEGSTTLGNYQYRASASINVRVPGFPSVLTNWADRQLEEIVNKLTDLPDIYFLYPDPTSMAGVIIPQEEGEQSAGSPPKPAHSMPTATKWSNFRTALSYINSIPLIQIEAKQVLIKIPALTKREIYKLEQDANQWLIDTREELERARQIWTCDADSEYRTLCDSIFLDMNRLIRSVEKNIEVLNKYKELPRRILAWREIRAKYAYQLICYMDAIMNYTGGYINKQSRRINAWIDMIRKVKETIRDWRLLIDIFVDYQASCDVCSSARFTLMELLLRIFLQIPSPPIIPFPKWPDLYIDVSQIQVGLRVLWPDLAFRPEPIIIPKLPRLRLPDAPTLTIILPELPILPDPPELPPLPDLPPLPLPSLPDIPPPPKVPQFPVSIKIAISILKEIMRILCLLKKGLIPVPETTLKSHIEQLTERPLDPLLPIDLGLNFQLPAIGYESLVRIEVIAELNLQLDFTFIYDFVKAIADQANSIATNLVKELNDRLQEAADLAQEMMEVELPEGIEESYTLDLSSSINTLTAINTDLGNATQGLIKAFEAIERDAEKYAQMAEEVEDIHLVASQEYLEKDDPILNRSLAEIKAGIANQPEYEGQERLIAMRDALIDLMDAQNAINGSLQYAQDDPALFSKLIAEAPMLDDYLDEDVQETEFSTLYASTEDITNTASSTVRLEDNALREFGKQVREEIADQIRLIADLSIADAPETPGMSQITPVNRGIFIIDDETQTNERLLNYTDEVDQPTSIAFLDMDNDGDGDVIYSFGGNVYLKENYKNNPVKTIISDMPGIYGINTFIPDAQAVAGFTSNYNNNKQVEMMWEQAEGNVSGYEIMYKFSPDEFADDSQTHKAGVIIEKVETDAVLPDNPDNTFRPDKVWKSYAVAENIENNIYFDGAERLFMIPQSGEGIVRQGNIVHTLTDSTISFGDNGEITLGANNSFILPSTVAGDSPIRVVSGAIEIINEKRYVKNQRLINGMHIEYDDVLVSQGGHATIRFLDGSYIRIESNEDLFLKKLDSPANPQVKFNADNGFYYAVIRSFDEIGQRSTASPIALMAPSICADNQPPFPNAGASVRNISIFKPLYIDASNSFDTDGIITGYWIDDNLERDSDGDGDPTNDKNIGNDLNPDNDFDGDDIENNDFDDPEFTLGPYEDLDQRVIKVNVSDEANNVAGQEITINIYVPAVTLLQATDDAGEILGEIDPRESEIPISVFRDRDGILDKIITDSADLNGKYITDEKGEFSVTDLNLEDTIIIRNSEGEIIAEIDPETGQIDILDDNYYVEVLPAEEPLLPTRIVIRQEPDGEIISAVFLVPDINTDTTIDPSSLPYDESTVAVFTGVHIRDNDPLDEFEFRKIPTDDPNYPGGTEIIETTTDRRAAIIDTGGNFYVLDDRLSLRMRGGQPLVLEIVFTEGNETRVIGEIYIAVDSDAGLHIVDPDRFSVFVEGAPSRGPLYDGDGDGMPDQWELIYGFDPTDASDGAQDADGDGISNAAEYRTLTNPLNPDTDGDGFSDSEELVFGQNPREKASSPFADVDESHPYYESIIDLIQRNVLEGIPSGSQLYFGPDEPITRAEFSHIMLEIFCIIPRPEAYNAPSVFRDIPYVRGNNPWYYAVIKEAYFQGFVTGYLGTSDPSSDDPEMRKPLFRPANSITRAEAVKVILEALEREQVIDMQGVTVGTPWYVPYMNIAQDLTPYLTEPGRVRNIYIITRDEAASPMAAITRAEFVAMADRVLTTYDCTEVDDDHDGMSDYFERKYMLDPTDPSDANEDPDGDGLSNLEEYIFGTDPRNPDTDGGGVSDGDEVNGAMNPLDASDDPIDTDGDGLTDRDETNTFGTDPNIADTDGGGIDDGTEVLIIGSDPLDGNDDLDSDGDGLNNDDEINVYDTDPFDADTDGGGVNDGDEIDRGTDPREEHGDDDLIDPRSDLDEGVYVIQDECFTCPCPFALDHTADIIAGDQVFAVISNSDDSEIFSRSNYITITGIPEP